MVNDVVHIRRKMQKENGHKDQEEPIYVCDKSDNGKWVREEGAVDISAIECVTSRKSAALES